MDEGQRKLLIGAIAVIVLAIVIWFVFIKNGPQNGVSNLPENKAAATKRPMPSMNGPGGGAGRQGSPAGPMPE